MHCDRCLEREEQEAARRREQHHAFVKATAELVYPLMSLEQKTAYNEPYVRYARLLAGKQN